MADSKSRRSTTAVPDRQRGSHTKNDEERPFNTLSAKLFPVFVVLIGIFVTVYYRYITFEPDAAKAALKTCQRDFNHNFRINSVRHQAETLSTRSWSLDAAVEAVEELINPEKAVFGLEPFPGDRIPGQGLLMDTALLWVSQKIQTVEGAQMLFDDGEEGGASNAAALGVAATMIGQRWPRYLHAAERQKEFLLNGTTLRAYDGVTGHRDGVAEQQPEVWAEGVARTAPFLAYYGVAVNDTALVREAARQIRVHRGELQITTGAKKGLWKHTATGADDGAWSTGNAMVAYSMARVRTTITAWKPSASLLQREKDDLDLWITEILDAAIATDSSPSKLLRNYLGDESASGETSGTALLAATAYRMAVLKPGVFAAKKYVDWAAEKRREVVATVDKEGVPRPVGGMGSAAEAASFLVMLASAWRDCVCAGVCGEA